MIELLALAPFAGLLIYAACTDIAALTIPNWISIALAATFPLAAFAADLPWSEIGLHYLFGFGVLGVGFFLFAANIFGGGDAKLLAAAAVWTGFPALGPLLLGTALAGGALAVGLLAARRFAPQNETHPAFVKRLLTPNSGVPYGVAIMAGGLMAIPALPVTVATLTLP